ncbi:hypothetical protein QCA50_016100 [Cerrena zonata]|uniref:Uncharacterized protein n=1 Tax=Cerrena zonata TaxID=2478898 RepID=A0AAW0FNC3_9APHY
MRIPMFPLFAVLTWATVDLYFVSALPTKYLQSPNEHYGRSPNNQLSLFNYKNIVNMFSGISGSIGLQIPTFASSNANQGGKDGASAGKDKPNGAGQSKSSEGVKGANPKDTKNK